MTIEELRAELTALDGKILELVARRQQLSAEVAIVKRAAGLSTRDFQRERDVVLRARTHAERLGIDAQLAESIMRQLIHSSLATQEQAQVAAQGQGLGQRALVIGGRGKMGSWFVDFLASQGYAVTVADPAGGLPGMSHVARWEDDALDAELIIVATPLAVTATVLEALALRRPRGLIFDLGSLKTPLRKGIAALKSAGCRVTSVHPMFGPDTQMLSGRHVIFIDLGDPSALRQAQELFGATMAVRVVMGLDEHDRLIAYILGLSHAVNIAFFTALADSGEAAPRLAQLSSTTFDAQLDVARTVAEESPELYFEIQTLNDYGHESLQALSRAVTTLLERVNAHDASGFAALMRAGKAYFDGRAAASAPR
jgi:chorismate mutase / prephenate dehydrogenase